MSETVWWMLVALFGLTGIASVTEVYWRGRWPIKWVGFRRHRGRSQK